MGYFDFIAICLAWLFSRPSAAWISAALVVCGYLYFSSGDSFAFSRLIGTVLETI